MRSILRLRIHAYWRVANLLPGRLIFALLASSVMLSNRVSRGGIAAATAVVASFALMCVVTVEDKTGRCAIAFYTARMCRILRIHKIQRCDCVDLPLRECRQKGLELHALAPVLDKLKKTATNRWSDELFARTLMAFCLVIPYLPIGQTFLPELKSPERLEFGALIGTALWVNRAHLRLGVEAQWAMKALTYLLGFIHVAPTAAGFYLLPEVTRSSALHPDQMHLLFVVVSAILLVAYRGVALHEFAMELILALVLMVLGAIYLVAFDPDEEVVLAGFIVGHFVCSMFFSLSPLLTESLGGRHGR